MMSPTEWLTAAGIFVGGVVVAVLKYLQGKTEFAADQPRLDTQARQTALGIDFRDVFEGGSIATQLEKMVEVARDIHQISADDAEIRRRNRDDLSHLTKEVRLLREEMEAVSRSLRSGPPSA